MIEDKIRIGLLLDGDELPLWAYQMLERILAAGHSEIVLRVIRQHEHQKPAPKGLVKKMLADPRHALFMLYRKFDRKNYKAKQNAFESRSLSDLIQTDELLVTPKSTRLSDRLMPEDLEKIKAYNVDLFIRFGFKILRGEILTMAKYGVWSYHHGDNRVHRGSVGAAWEVVQGWGETGASLQILTEDLDGGTLLGRSTIQTAKRYSENRNQLYWTASALLPQKLNQLVRLGGEEFMRRVKEENRTPEFYNNQLFRMPDNRVMFPVIRDRIWAKIKHKINKRLYFKQWILLYAFSRKEGLSRSFFRFKRLTPPKDRIWADPFVYQKDDTYYLFVEELLINAPKKGYIAVMEMDKKGNLGESRKIIETDYHLSYPFLWEEAGELYMIPESSQNKTIDLYRCESFPDRWVHHKTLMKDIEAVDSTVIKREGKYWLFANVKEFPDASSHDKLFLFSTDDLLKGNWEPHPMNPIVREVRYARPAGNIFEYEGKLYRPAQNNAGHYGAGMQIQEIVELNEEFYKEVNVESIYPNWDKELFSTHTINSVGKLTVIDAQIMRKR